MALHAQRDSREVTAPARAACLARFAREVDPDGKLEPEERERRALYARKEYFTRLALRAAETRAARIERARRRTKKQDRLGGSKAVLQEETRRVSDGSA
jgi:hypothetical protein